MFRRQHARHWVLVVALLVGATIFLCAGPSAGNARSGSAPAPDSAAGNAPLAMARDTTPDLRLALNIPAFRLDVFERGALTRTYGVAPGMPSFRTPVGAFRIDHVVWNPSWIPPNSEWARDERPQPPGWANPVGRVKMHVTDLVFLHGSPHDRSIGTAASHACIRMHNSDAIALARLVVAYGAPDVAPSTLDSLVADTARTRTMQMALTVPFHVRYELAEVRDDTLFLYRDVYGFAGKRVPTVRSSALGALSRAGVDTLALRGDRLRTLIRRAARATSKLPLDSLVTPAERQADTRS